MSGRRSTRAASSRASSIAGSDSGLATPRRSTRNNPGPGSPLPPLASRESTSYGSSIAVVPMGIRTLGHERDLTDALTGILGTVQENIQSDFGLPPNPPHPSTSTGLQEQFGSEISSRGRGRGRGRGRASSVTSTPGNDNTVSFQDESIFFRDALFKDGVHAPSRHGGSVAEENPEVVDQEEVIEQVTGPVSLWMQVNAWFRSIFELTVSAAGTLAQSLFGYLSYVARFFSSKWALLVLFLLLAGIASLFNPTPTTGSLFDEDLRPVGFGFRQQIRQWVPFPIAHPLSYLNNRDVSNLQKRMSAAENELHSMRKHTVLNKEVLQGLKAILPEELYVSKGNGHTELPASFWKALKQKFTEISSTFKDESEIITYSEWEAFNAQNEVTVKAWQAESFEDSWAQHLQESLKDGGVLISKADVIQMIEKRWRESQVLIEKEVKKELGDLSHSIEVNRQNTQAITAQDAITLSKGVFNEMYKNLQLKAFAQVQESEQIAYHHLHRPNHFSFGLGAVINPSVTSPTYEFGSERAWFPKRWLLWSIGYGLPSPNPPAEALRKWDEAGDCWCSPTKGTGTGVQLGVLMANDLFPKEVIIEHIPKSATLDSASTPFEMELFANVESFEGQGKAGELSAKMFPDAHESELSREWILIGTWRYDIEHISHVQHFYPQLDLQSIGISTRQLVVRAKNNQGDSDHTCLYRVRVHGEVVEKANV